MRRRSIARLVLETVLLCHVVAVIKSVFLRLAQCLVSRHYLEGFFSVVLRRPLERSACLILLERSFQRLEPMLAAHAVVFGSVLGPSEVMVSSFYFDSWCPFSV